jgi:hypothetical protein
MRFVPILSVLIAVLSAVASISAFEDDSCKQDCRFRHNVDRTFDGHDAFRGADSWNRWEAYKKCVERCEEKSDSAGDW